MDRNRELAPDNWSLVKERVLTTGLCSEGWYSEHSGVCTKWTKKQKNKIWLSVRLYLRQSKSNILHDQVQRERTRLKGRKHDHHFSIRVGHDSQCLSTNSDSWYGSAKLCACDGQHVTTCQHQQVCTVASVHLSL